MYDPYVFTRAAAAAASGDVPVVLVVQQARGTPGWAGCLAAWVNEKMYFAQLLGCRSNGCADVCPVTSCQLDVGWQIP